MLIPIILFFRRSASLEFFDGAVIRSFTVHTSKKDTFWVVKVNVNLETGEHVRNIKGYLSIYLSVEGHQTFKIGKNVETMTNNGLAEVEMELTVSKVSIT